MNKEVMTAERVDRVMRAEVFAEVKTELTRLKRSVTDNRYSKQSKIEAQLHIRRLEQWMSNQPEELFRQHGGKLTKRELFGRARKHAETA